MTHESRRKLPFSKPHFEVNKQGKREAESDCKSWPKLKQYRLLSIATICLSCWLMSRHINCWGKDAVPRRVCVHVGWKKWEKKKKKVKLTTFLSFGEATSRGKKQINRLSTRFSSCFWELGHFRLRFIFHIRHSRRHRGVFLSVIFFLFASEAS